MRIPGKEVQGEITAFLTILFALMAAFICSIAEVAAIHEEKCYRRTDMDLALYSVFGEYQRELLEQYHIFGMDAGYESGNYSEQAVIGRLHYYGAEDMELDITDLQFLTDNQGAAFYEQVLYYMETRYGMGIVQKFTGMTRDWEEQMVQGEVYYERKVSETEQLTVPDLPQTDESQEEESAQPEDGRAPAAAGDTSLPETEEAAEARDSLITLKNQDDTWILQNILPDGFEVSDQAVALEELPSYRTLNRGYGSFRQREMNGVLEKLLFGEYLLQNFCHALKPESGRGLAYEIEYIIGGKGSDRENLEATAKRLVLLRFAADYAYLLTDEARKAEAGTAALTICTLLMAPQMAEAVKQVLLLMWAYREGMLDVKYLLSGKNVVLQKTNDTWRLPLGGIIGIGDGVDEKINETAAEEGLSYSDYLRILLFLVNREDCAMRSLDLIETGLRIGKALSFFRVDCCISKMKVKSNAVLRQGIVYDFSTEFFYR